MRNFENIKPRCAFCKKTFNFEKFIKCLNLPGKLLNENRGKTEMNDVWNGPKIAETAFGNRYIRNAGGDIAFLLIFRFFEELIQSDFWKDI